MDASTIALVIIAASQLIGVCALLAVALGLRPRLLELTEQLSVNLLGLQRALAGIDQLLGDIRSSRVLYQASETLSSLKGGAGQLEPLAAEVKSAISGLASAISDARELMEDATQTSQAVRTRVEDLAATQTELHALSKALADITCDLRDSELSQKLSNLLTDTSLLAADIGILAENASSILDTGRPLVSNVSTVVEGAQKRAAGISGAIGAIKDTFRPGK